MIRRGISILGYGFGSLVLAGATVMAIVCSVGMNAYFGFMKLGGQVADITALTLNTGVTVAVAGLVSIDIMKAFLPLFCARAWHHQQYGYVFVGSIVVAGGVALSLLASFGFLLEHRVGVTSERQAAGVSLAALQSQIVNTRKQLESLGTPRPVATIEAALAAQRQHQRWASTQGCTDATVRESRDFCEAYNTLQAELGTAAAAAAAQVQLAALLKQQDGLLAEGMKPADPQLETLAHITGWQTTTVAAVMFAVVAVMIEFVSAFGLLLAFGHGGRSNIAAVHASPPAPPAPAALAHRSQPEVITAPAKALEIEPPRLLPPATLAVVDDFTQAQELSDYGVARLEQVTGAAVGMRDLYTDYRAWCSEVGRRPMAQRMFAETLRRLAAQTSDIELGRQGRKKVLMNMRLRSVETTA